jgi:hypothetical protein
LQRNEWRIKLPKEGVRRREDYVYLRYILRLEWGRKDIICMFVCIYEGVRRREAYVYLRYILRLAWGSKDIICMFVCIYEGIIKDI